MGVPDELLNFIVFSETFGEFVLMIVYAIVKFRRYPSIDCTAISTRNNINGRIFFFFHFYFRPCSLAGSQLSLG